MLSKLEHDELKNEITEMFQYIQDRDLKDEPPATRERIMAKLEWRQSRLLNWVDEKLR